MWFLNFRVCVIYCRMIIYNLCNKVLLEALLPVPSCPARYSIKKLKVNVLNNFLNLHSCEFVGMYERLCKNTEIKKNTKISIKETWHYILLIIQNSSNLYTIILTILTIYYLNFLFLELFHF